MSGRFAGKRIWITGASAGIGEGLALAFAREGAELILSARREEELERVRLACADPDKAKVVPLDLADGDGLVDRAAEVWSEYGPVDYVVHNGGISQRSLVRETDIAVDRKLMEVNFFGAVALTKGLLPQMMERGAGHFVVITSVTGKVGTKLRSGYSASKHALHGFFDALRAEEFDRGIRVTLACPGFVRTDVSRNALVGDGSAHNEMDSAQEAGMSTDKAARIILKAVAAEKNEVYLGGKEVMAIYLQRLSPGLASKVMRKAKVT